MISTTATLPPAPPPRPIPDATRRAYYEALLQRRSDHEGVFFVGVTTTGIFCRPTCPARKPRFEHCEFFPSAQEALLASYRPCKRCQPLSLPGTHHDAIAALIDAVEAEPARRWTDRDFRDLGIDASTARRQFKKRFGMTFVAYARARRMGMAMQLIRSGSPVIDAQQETGFESGSGFRDAFARIMGTAPVKARRQQTVLNAAWIDTRLGPMIAIADEEALVLLEFVDRRGLEREVERLRQRLGAAIVPGQAAPLRSIEHELGEYFEGRLRSFATPVRMLGTPFQCSVWERLQAIPYGATATYGEQAAALGNPAAVRAVARANGTNQLAIVIPCHRVVGKDGGLVGYAGGVARKQWLLEHERSNR